MSVSVLAILMQLALWYILLSIKC